jgi:hypothetical protein
MKKTHILALALPFSINSSFAAIEPEVYVGGMMNFNYLMTDQAAAYSQDYLPIDFNNSSNENGLNEDILYAHDAYLDVFALGKEDNGFLYGGKLTLQLNSNRQHNYTYDTSGVKNTSDSSPVVGVRRSFIFFEKKTFGRFEFGDTEGPSKKMKFDAGYKFGGTGGISGDWWRYINVPDFYLTYSNDTSATDASDVQSSSGSGNKGFIIRPDLPLAHGYTPEYGAYKIDDTLTLSRVSYYSPRISNFQFGISYAPDSGQRGSSYYGEGFSDDGDVIDVIDWGLNYVQQFSNDFGIAFSYTGEMGYAQDTTTILTNAFIQKDLMAHSLGFYAFKGNFNISASYGSWGDSLMFVKDDLTSADSNYRDAEANYMTFGLGYQFGAYKLSFANMTSTYRQQEFSLSSVAFDYRMTKDLNLYAEVNSYEFDVFSDDEDTDYTDGITKAQSIDNSGSVLMLGIKVTFGGIDNTSSVLLDTQQQY